MQSSRKTLADHKGGDCPAKKRRKLTENSPTDTHHQRSLSDLFREQEYSAITGQESPRSSDPSRKTRHRIEHHRTTSPPSNNSLERMYSFPTTRPSSNGVIDLTGSSPPSPPHARKTSNNTFARQTSFTPHQGAKKLVVKNLRTTPRVDPEQYFRRVWDQLDTALTTVFGGGNSKYSLEELYRGAENLCRQGRSGELYTRLRARCETHLLSQVREELVEKVSQLSDVDFLSSYLESWRTWSGRLMTIRSMFHYMDQTYLLRNAEYPGVTQMGHVFFKVHVFEDKGLRPKIMRGVMETIELDRRTMADEELSILLKKSIAMFHDLGTYFSDFEPSFSKSSGDFFGRWAIEEIAKDDLSSYVNNSHTLFASEITRCELYNFDRSTRAGLTNQFDQLLVEQRHDFLTNEDSNLQILEKNDAGSLEQVYSLLERVGKGADLGPIFDQYVREDGCAIVFDEKREPEMVLRLLEFKRRLDYFHKHSFHGSETIGNGLHKSFEFFINKTKKTQANWDTDNAKPGEMIAKHVDLLLKGGVKAIPMLAAATKDAPGAVDDDYDEEKGADEDAEINHHLSLALDLFRFVHGKAVFEAFYKKDLARRLLMGRSASNDAERNMLSRLRTECGAGFTHNLESMFKDMDLARDEMISYNQLQSDRGAKGSGPDLNVNVLSSAAWPTYSDVSVTIPPAISKLTSDFETYYYQKHSGRKLHWKHALSHCQLKASYPKGVRKEIVVSGFQAIVLLLFNDLPSSDTVTPTTLSYTDIRSATSLPDPELQRTLQSLACAKYRVLTKHPKGRDVKSTDIFAYNPHFTDPKTRIKINQIQLKETKEENKETHQRVAADRHYETQAAIVRVMKSRKTIGHAELVAEVIKATRSRGVLELGDIKKNIDKCVPVNPPSLTLPSAMSIADLTCCRLMEKDYMERTDGNNYAYVA
jgi:nuclear pore complex protein Nup205